MVKPARLVYCSKCGRPGHRKLNSVTREFHYPADDIPVPEIEDIISVSGAWDYASKVCLHSSAKVLRFPPSEETDLQAAPVFYDEFRRFTTHTDADIAEFESRHRKLIEQRVSKQQTAISQQSQQQKELGRILPDYGPLSFDTFANKEEKVKHRPLPHDTGRITRLSLALLYGAIVCKAISNEIYNEDCTIEPSEKEKIAAAAICNHYSLFYFDDKMYKHPLSWIEIILDVYEEGLGASINKHKIVSAKGDKVKKLSRKHVKNTEGKVLLKARDIIVYTPIFDRLFEELCRHFINEPDNAIRLLEDFSNLENPIYDPQRTYPYADVVHDDGTRCRICPYESLRIVKTETSKGV